MAIQTLDRVISEASGTSTRNFAEQNLLAPLEMNSTTIGTDKNGQMIMAAGVKPSARDMARLGYLAMNDGQWKGQQVVSSEYVSDMLTPGELNTAYGRLWWLNTEVGPWNKPSLEPIEKCVRGTSQYRPYLPDVPFDAYLAAGKGGQFILVSPSDNLIIVRQGQDPGQDQNIANDLYREVAASFLQ